MYEKLFSLSRPGIWRGTLKTDSNFSWVWGNSSCYSDCFFRQSNECRYKFMVNAHVYGICRAGERFSPGRILTTVHQSAHSLDGLGCVSSGAFWCGVIKSLNARDVYRRYYFSASNSNFPEGIASSFLFFNVCPYCENN